MRRGIVTLMAVLAILSALPASASARSRGLPGLFGIIASPIGALLGGGRHRGHRAAQHSRHRGSVASRRAPAAAVAAVPAVGAAATAATATRSAHDASTPRSTIKAETNGAKPAEPEAQSAAEVTNPDEPGTPQAAAVRAQASSPETTGTAPASPAAPADTARQNRRSAALTPPDHELRPAIGEHPRSAKPASSHLGHLGPLTWPTAFEDVIGYTLWPDQYGERLRAHGMADVLGAVFVSPAMLAATARPISVQAKAEDSGGAPPAVNACDNVQTAASDWPTTEIARSMELTPEQQASLNQLKSSVADAAASIASSCRDTANLGPVQRLHAMQAVLWTVHDAAQMIRAPLAAFYDSLSEDQKKQFSGSSAENNADPRAMSRNQMARMCGMPVSLESSMRQIERAVQTTKAQRASLEALNKRSFEMGQFLMASCLKPIPATPAERLDNATDRLIAVLFAASNIGPPINDFYAQLSDEQKAKLKTLH